MYFALPAQTLASGAAPSWTGSIVISAEEALAYYEKYKLARKHDADDGFEQAFPLLQDLVRQQAPWP